MATAAIRSGDSVVVVVVVAAAAGGGGRRHRRSFVRSLVCVYGLIIFFALDF